MDSTSPQVLVRTCEWWDRQRNAKPGLLVWKIRQGGVTEEPRRTSKTSELRVVFDAFSRLHMEGAVLESHQALAARRWPDYWESCPGSIRVVECRWPVMELECDVCGFRACLTPRSMRGGA